MATYLFSVSYQAGDAAQSERGQEVLTFIQRGGAWKAVWRTQVFLGPA